MPVVLCKTKQFGQTDLDSPTMVKTFWFFGILCLIHSAKDFTFASGSEVAVPQATLIAVEYRVFPVLTCLRQL